MWANKSICSNSDFNLAYVAEFQYKAGYAKKKPVGMETLDTHFLLTVYILYNFVFTSQCEKVAYFYDVGSTYAIDQKINHLHNDRVANMWRNKFLPYAVEDNIERKKN